MPASDSSNLTALGAVPTGSDQHVGGRDLAGAKGFESAAHLSPAFRWILENRVNDLEEEVRAVAATADVALLDSTTNMDVEGVGRERSVLVPASPGRTKCRVELFEAFELSRRV